MINFKSFLTEARMAPLYHGTNGAAVKEMIEFDTLRTGVERAGYHGKQVSLTRDLNFALRWGSIVLELNQQKLAQRYKIVPYNFFGRDYKAARQPQKEIFIFTNQYEEAVKADIKPMSSYLEKIIIPISSRRTDSEYIKSKYPLIYNDPKAYLYNTDSRKFTKINS